MIEDGGFNPGIHPAHPELVEGRGESNTGHKFAARSVGLSFAFSLPPAKVTRMDVLQAIRDEVDKAFEESITFDPRRWRGKGIRL
jgi:hypothetical protein